jgi:hypothetical protein
MPLTCTCHPPLSLRLERSCLCASYVFKLCLFVISLP